jgi:hypothetical protein
MDKVTKIACFFDIASSSTVLEELKINDSLDNWANLLLDLEGFLTRNTNYYKYEIYKFLGDGWILLFDCSQNGESLVDYLRTIHNHYMQMYNKLIKPVLSRSVSLAGITCRNNIWS